MSTPLSPDFINEQLNSLCQTEGVRCVFAVESGSRAWGFASPDSDYDVRFIYIRPTADYLRITRPRDVIESTEETHDLDMVGWDLPKALQLLSKSNPSIIEWLHTADIYQQDDASVRILKQVAQDCFSAKALAMHYTALAHGHVAKYITDKQTIAPKKYFYGLRAILSAAYVIDHNLPAPIPFDDLLAASSLPAGINAITADLLVVKKQGKEKQQVDQIDELNDFIHTQLATLDSAVLLLPTTQSRDRQVVVEEAFAELLRLQP